jgi:hypothetical protein
MRITWLYSGDDGESHFADLDVPDGEVLEGHALGGDELGGPRRDYDYHPAPRRQLVIAVTGLMEVVVSGGGVQAEVYYRSHRTADGFIAIGCLNPRQQRRLNAALHLGDPRFDTQHPETPAPLAPE